MHKHYSAFQFVFFQVVLALGLLAWVALQLFDTFTFENNVRAALLPAELNVLEFITDAISGAAGRYLAVALWLPATFALLLGVQRRAATMGLIYLWLNVFPGTNLLSLFFPLALVASLLFPEMKLGKAISNPGEWQLTESAAQLLGVLMPALLGACGGLLVYLGFIAADGAPIQGIVGLSMVVAGLLWLAPQARPLGWLMALVSSGLLLFSGSVAAGIGLLMLLWLVLDARWLKPAKATNGQPMVYFDGVCGLCNSFIDLLFVEDRHNVLKFTPIQGDTAAKNFPEGDLQQFDSIGYSKEGALHFKSTAALMILRDIGGIWKLLWVFVVLPRSFRDAVYDFIARNRYKWFGKHETCRMPSPEERAKLLP